MAIALPTLLHLLQLASPALPIGAYTYSEGLETLVQGDRLTEAAQLQHWLTQELRLGTVRLDAAAMLRAYRAYSVSDFSALTFWNHWLSALRESEELRQQHWQMGRSLSRLLRDLDPVMGSALVVVEDPCNLAIAFGVAAAHWQIEASDAIAAYLHSWASNLINAGVKLIPLGQTQGQQLLQSLYPAIDQATADILSLPDAELGSWGWGVAIASMTHETLYSRLFRS